MFAIVLAVSMAVSAGALAYAAGGEPDTAPCTDGRYFWKIESKTYKGYKYNDWKNITNVISGSFNNVNFHIADANTQAHFLGQPFTSFYGQVIEINNNCSYI